MRAIVLIVVATATTMTAAADDAADRAIVTTVDRGELAWHQACPVDEIDGACVRVAARHVGTRTRPAQCGPESIKDVVVVPRDPAKLRDAVAAFTDAIAHGSMAASPKARAAVAQAKLRDADRDFESYLAMTLPADLDFDPARPAVTRTSIARFDSWMTAKRAAAGVVNDKLRAVIALHDAPSSIAAAARLGQLTLSFANRLLATEIPPAFRKSDDDIPKIEAFCDKLAVVAEPLELDATAAFESCLVMSGKLAWFDDSSRTCERELSRLRPQDFPVASELRRDATATPTIEVEGPR